jgi:pSer/pThr/pTyr-binding forkhead associated (FHA) protein
MKRSSQSRKELSEDKERRRKKKNAQMLFPSDSPQKDPNGPLELHAEPVQLIRIDLKSDSCIEHSRYTIWTNCCTVGSDSDCCDIPIDHSSVALRHAQFAHDEFGFYVEALQENKPTFRNRQRIRSNVVTYLEEGDIVGLGDLEFKTHFIHDTVKDQL